MIMRPLARLMRAEPVSVQPKPLDMRRRGFLGAMAGLIAAPALVRADTLMPISVQPKTVIYIPPLQRTFKTVSMELEGLDPIDRRYEPMLDHMAEIARRKALPEDDLARHAYQLHREYKYDRRDYGIMGRNMTHSVVVDIREEVRMRIMHEGLGVPAFPGDVVKVDGRRYAVQRVSLDEQFG